MDVMFGMAVIAFWTAFYGCFKTVPVFLFMALIMLYLSRKRSLGMFFTLHFGMTILACKLFPVHRKPKFFNGYMKSASIAPFTVTFTTIS
jgi:hypothetical protein